MPIPDPAVDDATLVDRCRTGDAAAWALLVGRYQRVVYGIVRRSGLDEQSAGDVFQTVFLRLFEQLPRLADPARLPGWIVTTAKREAWLQRSRAQRTVSMTTADGDADSDDPAGPWAIADEAAGPDDTVSHWQQLAGVQRALERLEQPCRRLLQALFGDEDSGYDAVSRRLGLPVGSIGPMRARCLAKLRRWVG